MLFITFIIIPVLNSINLSLTNWDGINKHYDYIGLTNFRLIFDNERFYNALKNTIIIGLSFTVLANIVSLALAIIVDHVIIGKSLFRSLFYLPSLISGVISGFIWTIMFNYSFGIINSLFEIIGLHGLEIDFLGASPNALIAIIFVMVWQRSGYYMVIYLAGLQGIPRELLESSHIDGANAIQRFRHITFPLLSGSFTVNMTLALIAGFKVFDQIAVMTDGGPGFATESITYLIYRVAFAELKQGYGTAMSLVLFVLVLIVTVIQVVILRKREVQL
jgi:ABC-type sugar transport system permease subunit